MLIGELAGETGTTTTTLRFYEEQGLVMAAARTPAGYREYTPDAVARVGFIHRAQAAGLSLAQIRQILDIRDGGEAPCTHVRELLDARLAEVQTQISELASLRDTIALLRANAEDVRPDRCAEDEVCQYV